MEVDVGDRDLGGVVVKVPIEACLLLPLEVLDVFHAEPFDVDEDVALVHIDDDHRLDLLARPLAKVAELLVRAHVDGDEVGEALLVLLVGGLDDALLSLGAIERVLRVGGPLELDADERNLRLVLVRELLGAHVLGVGRRVADDAADRDLHLAEQLAEPVLDVALCVDDLRQLD